MTAQHPLAKTVSPPSLPFTVPTALPTTIAALSLPLFTASGGWESAQQRRLGAREAFKLQDEGAINDYTLRLINRQQRLYEIRRAQFEAEQRLLVAGEAQQDRETQKTTVLETMASLEADLGLARAQYEISRALASPENDVLLAPDNPTLIAREVNTLKEARLRAEVQVDAQTGVRRARVLWPAGHPPRNVRVLYAASRDALKELCDRLETQIQTAEASAEKTRVQRAQEREEEIKRLVKQRLEGLQSQSEPLALRLDQEDSLGQTLLVEELPTRRASVPLPPRAALRPLKLAETPAGTPLPLPRRPLRALQEEVRATVLDEATRRGIQVRFSPAPGIPDRTAEFAQWIKVSLP